MKNRCVTCVRDCTFWSSGRRYEVSSEWKKLCKPDGVWLWMNNKYNFICVQFKMCFSFFGICNYHYQFGVRCIRIDTSLMLASVWVSLTMKTSGKNVFCIFFRVTVVDVNRHESTPPACVFLDRHWRHVDRSSISYAKFLYTCDHIWSLIFILQDRMWSNPIAVSGMVR